MTKNEYVELLVALDQAKGKLGGQGWRLVSPSPAQPAQPAQPAP